MSVLGNKKRVPFPKLFCMSHMSDSNQRPTHYECVALPTELKWPHFAAAKIGIIHETERIFLKKCGFIGLLRRESKKISFKIY